MKSSMSKREERVAYVMLVLPALFMYLFVMGFPTVFSVILSFSNFKAGGEVIRRRRHRLRRS